MNVTFNVYVSKVSVSVLDWIFFNELPILQSDGKNEECVQLIRFKNENCKMDAGSHGNIALHVHFILYLFSY